ncbi:hypothetical protein NJF44_24555 [Pseudomonas guariconensis]|nr:MULTISPECIES: hypothetical protein [Pseudomonas]MCO7639425.1 hypothetical protein [Pseudomonas sp. S 311-6]MCO7517919.1 hypothetical protein [Pseudomonas putida]MCO7565129.1 hypothetical protein [Pseudomonas mosselii]MCO7608404.1 hypothetical protein [Pseudomonas guariconensis]MCO7616272.1 hypothetical protein [Pseudomonas guariconensis]
MNKQADWTCYPEAAGFDILAVHTSGRQIGIEAKMTLNAKVADQILPKDYENFYGRPGPDHRLVIVGKASDASHGIGRMLGLLGVPVLLPRWMHRGGDKSGWEFDIRCLNNRDWMSFFVNEEYLHLFDWNPAERCRVPMVVGAHQAGVPSPVSLTPWKEAALRVIALMRSQGHIASKQIQEFGISPTAWTRPKGNDPAPQRHLADSVDFSRCEAKRDHQVVERIQNGRAGRADRQEPDCFPGQAKGRKEGRRSIHQDRGGSDHCSPLRQPAQVLPNLRSLLRVLLLHGGSAW